MVPLAPDCPARRSFCSSGFSSREGPYFGLFILPCYGRISIIRNSVGIEGVFGSIIPIFPSTPLVLAHNMSQMDCDARKRHGDDEGRDGSPCTDGRRVRSGAATGAGYPVNRPRRTAVWPRVNRRDGMISTHSS